MQKNSVEKLGNTSITTVCSCIRTIAHDDVRWSSFSRMKVWTTRKWANLNESWAKRQLHCSANTWNVFLRNIFYLYKTGTKIKWSKSKKELRTTKIELKQYHPVAPKKQRENISVVELSEQNSEIQVIFVIILETFLRGSAYIYTTN